MKNKTRILFIVALITFIAILLCATNAHAAEYADKDKSLIITMDELGIDGTIKKVETKWEENEYKSEYDDRDFYIYNNVTIEKVNQAKLNEYAKTPKTLKANIRLKLPDNDVSKIVFSKSSYIETEHKNIEEDINKEYKIETINGNKYLVYDNDLYYQNVSGQEPVDSNIGGILLHDYKLDTYMLIKIYKSNGSYQKCSLNTNIEIISENKPFNYTFGYENKYGQLYPVGGAGGGDFEDKWYLTIKQDIEGWGHAGIYWIPTDTKLSEAYATLYIDVYQGDKIEIEEMGTLSFVGVSKTSLWGQEGTYYVYKNSLDNLKKWTKTVNFKAKTESNYVLTRGIYEGWTFEKASKEEQIKVEDTDIVLNMLRYEDRDLELGQTKAKKTDVIYKKIEVDGGASDLTISLGSLCIVSGTYEGNINITFDVGAENNGKQYRVYYNRDWISYDVYEGKVKDGKVTITVNTDDIKRANDNIIKPGDVNGDGKINTKDAREVLLAYIGKNKLTDAQRITADVNKDGKINTKDARQILLYYIGKINKF